MSTSHLIGTSGLAELDRLCSPDLVELVDALVEAVDLNRWTEIDRLRLALEPFGVVPMFDAELRLNGLPSDNEGCICGGGER
jgi:hypothetical protein